MLKRVEPSKQEKVAEKIVKCLLEIRENLEEINRRYEAEQRPYLEKQDKILGTADKFLEKIGGKSVKTDFGTLYLETKITFSVEHPDLFNDYILRTGEIFLLQTRAHETACLEFREE